MAHSNTEDVRASFSVDGLEQEQKKLHVLSFRGEEGMSRLFRFELELASPSAGIAFEDTLGRPALLTLKRKDARRYVHGVINRFEQRERGDGLTIYHATLVPAAWQLVLRRDCRIFQEAPILAKQLAGRAIINSVLQGMNIEFDVVAFSGGNKLKDREFCVQYRESDWNFVSRLLEEEGFFYFFSHQQDRHLLKIGNDYQFHKDIKGSAAIDFHPPDAMNPGLDQVFAFSFAEQMSPTRVTLNDYNFCQPGSPLLTSSENSGKNPELEVYDYPGLYEAKPQGKTLSDIRQQELRTLHRLGEGEGTCIRFCPGYRFQLEGFHQQFSDDNRFLLSHVRHIGELQGELDLGRNSQAVSYSNAFSCIPYKVTFRPPRITQKPRIYGTQTAVVTAAAGDMETDQYGRVKVQFHWDRQGKKDHNSSCWIRVSQPWTGAKWGAMAIPRVGQEVVVDFIEGDPDRPIIVGRVYNADNLPPNELPAQMTKTTLRTRSTPEGDGYNEITFEDKQGKEEFYTHAQRDRRERVLRDKRTTVDRDQHVVVSRDYTRLVQRDETVEVRGDRTLNVEGAQQMITHGDVKVITKGGVVEETAQSCSVSAKQITLSASDSIVLECGGASVKLNKMGMVQIKGSGPVSVDGLPVKINASAVGRPASRLGDPCTPGAIVFGSPTVLIGEAPGVPALAMKFGGVTKDPELSKEAGTEVHLPRRPRVVRSALEGARQHIARRIGQVANQLGVGDLQGALRAGQRAAADVEQSMEQLKASYEDVMEAAGQAQQGVSKGLSALDHLGDCGKHVGGLIDAVKRGQVHQAIDHLRGTLREASQVAQDAAEAADGVCGALDKISDAAAKAVSAGEGLSSAARRGCHALISIGDAADKVGSFCLNVAQWGGEHHLLPAGVADQISSAGAVVAQLGQRLSSAGQEGLDRLQQGEAGLAQIKEISNRARPVTHQLRSSAMQVHGLAGSASGPAKPLEDKEALAQQIKTERAQLKRARGEINKGIKQSAQMKQTLRHPSTSLGWRNTAVTAEQLKADSRRVQPQMRQALAGVAGSVGGQGQLAGQAAEVPAADAPETPASTDMPMGDSRTQEVPQEEQNNLDGGTVLIPLDRQEGSPEASQPDPSIMSPEAVAIADAAPDSPAKLTGARPTDPACSDEALQGSLIVDHPEQLAKAAEELLRRLQALGGEAVFENSFQQPNPQGYGDVHGTLLWPTNGGGTLMTLVRLFLRTYHDGSQDSLLARSERVAAVEDDGDADTMSNKQQANQLMALLAHTHVPAAVE